MYDKKIFILAFVALTLLLATACGKSNNDNPNPQDDAKKALIGTWKIESVTDDFMGKRNLTECDKKTDTLIHSSDNYGFRGVNNLIYVSNKFYGDFLTKQMDTMSSAIKF